MMVLRPDLGDEERDMELAKFEAFLGGEGGKDVRVTVRGRQRLAYPIKNFIEGIYVLYTYKARPETSQKVQRTLSAPEAGSELNVLRHMTFRL
jgi:small subunit ribosomal protein S6